MGPETTGSESPPAPVSLERLGTAGASQTNEESARGLPTPTEPDQLAAAAAGAAGPPEPSEQAVSGAPAATPPEPAALEQLGEESAGEATPPRPASPEELAARAEAYSSG